MAFSYIIALIIDAFLIFYSLIHVFVFDKLKTDFKTPVQLGGFFGLALFLSLKFLLNLFAVPEYLLLLFFNVLFVLSGEWLSFLINVPLILYHTNRHISVLCNYDQTSVIKADVLTEGQREGWIKLAFYLLSFFYYLYRAYYCLTSA